MNVSFEPRKSNGWVPALTVRSLLAALAALLGMGICIQYSTVVLGMEPSGEFGLPIPAIILLVGLLGAGMLTMAFLRFRLLGRAEMLCVFYILVIAAPLMTQGFWHRVLSITATIPRGGEFNKIDFFSDRLWPHGPNLLHNAFEHPILLQGLSPQEETKKTVLVPVAGKGAVGIVPGEPYLISFQARAERLGANAYYFVRARVKGETLYQEATRSRSSVQKDKLHPEGFVRVGTYGFVFSGLGDAKDVEIEFGLAGEGKLEVRDPKLINVSALEYAYSGLLVLPENDYFNLPPEDRAGIVCRPNQLFSLQGLAFLLRAYIPFEDWVTPVCTWGALLTILLGGSLAINVIMRRQWLEGERYPLPLAKIPSLLVGEPEEKSGIPWIWKQKVLWIGCSVGLLWGLLRGFHFYNPAVPDLAIKVDLGPYFGPGWGNFWQGVTFQVVGIFVAVAVFVELNVLMSLLVGFFAFRALFWVGYASGLSGLPGYPFPQQQQTGAFMAYGILVLVLSWKYLRGTLFEAVKPSPQREMPEIFSYRTAYLVLIAVLLSTVFWAEWVGVSIGGMIFYMIFMLLIAMVASKFRAESGVPYGFFTPNNAALLLLLLGGIPVFGADLLLLSFITSFILSVAVFFLIPGAQLEILELGRRYGVSPRHILGTIVLGVLGGVAVGGWIFLSNAYSLGGDSMRYEWPFATKTWYFGDFNAEMTRAASPESPAQSSEIPLSTWAFAYGGIISVVLGVLRQLFAGFWLHPIGFLLGPSYLSQMIWGSVLVAWFLRFVVVRFGGAQAVRGMLHPFFVGIFLGSIASWSVWFVYGAVLHARGIELIYGAIP